MSEDEPRMEEFRSDTGDLLTCVDGMFVAAAMAPPMAVEDAREEMQRALSSDMEYWGRLSSAVYLEEPGDVSQLQEEFREYAIHWQRCGKGLNLIGDFKAHISLRDERAQRRLDKKKAKEAAQRLRMALPVRRPYAPPSTRGPAAAQEPVELFPPVDTTMNFDADVALQMIVLIDKKLQAIEDVCENLPDINKEERDCMIAGYDHMMTVFMVERFKRRYGYNKSDHQARRLEFGQDVPSYFANVQDQSIHRRKVLSMAGLRNLVLYGPIIYHQLKEKMFSGELDAYKDNDGLKLMRRVTGNVVDLDTTVLRCSDRSTLNAINASNKHKKLPTFSSVEQFSKSPQAEEIALHCSQPLLDDFAKMMKLTEAQRKTRKIHPSQITTPFPVAGNNTDRGKHPIWHYVNCGQDSFHANVPTMEDVNGALLKAPYHCLMYWLQIHCTFQGDELERRRDEFFEDCVVDSCFNMKWKSIEEFGYKMRHEGTIVDILQRTQMSNQGIFTADFFDHDDDKHTNEIAEMMKLCCGKMGRETASGQLRAIVAADVEAWVNDPTTII